MESKNKKNFDQLMITKKYKLSFFGVSPKHDWYAALFLGVALIITFSLIYYFDNLTIKNSISGNNLVREQKNYFDITKAEKLLKDFEIKRSVIDQSL